MRVENLQRNWYVVYSKPHKERQAQFHLGLKGLESFFPRLLLTGSVERKSRIVPLFLNYLFVRIHLLTEYHYVIWSLGVKQMVMLCITLTPLDESSILFLFQRAIVG